MNKILTKLVKLISLITQVATCLSCRMTYDDVSAWLVNDALGRSMEFKCKVKIKIVTNILNEERRRQWPNKVNSNILF